MTSVPATLKGRKLIEVPEVKVAPGKTTAG